MSAQVTPWFAWTAATPPSRPRTGEGRSALVVDAMPSSPVEFSPQQYRAPPAIAQLWLPPHATAVAAAGRPVTVTGVSELVVLPLPSWPLSLLPQQSTAPVVRAAHPWSVPTEIEATPELSR